MVLLPSSIDGFIVALPIVVPVRLSSRTSRSIDFGDAPRRTAHFRFEPRDPKTIDRGEISSPKNKATAAAVFLLDNGVRRSPKRRKIVSLVFTCFCISKPLLIVIIDHYQRAHAMVYNQRDQ